jgi:hypothetical protein
VSVPEVVNPNDRAVATALEHFYLDLLYELGEHAFRGGTAIGAAAVLKRVARAQGLVIAERLPLPRFTRAELEARRDSRWSCDGE